MTLPSIDFDYAAKKYFIHRKNAENNLYFCRIIYFDMAKYIYQYKNWSDFTWQNATVSAALGEVRLLQGKILGQIHSLGFASKEEKNLEMLTLDVLKSSEIEGEKLNYDQVRSSIARRLGINTAELQEQFPICCLSEAKTVRNGFIVCQTKFCKKKMFITKHSKPNNTVRATYEKIF
jgi:hypothetical protein